MAEADSKTEVIRRALAVYEILLEHKGNPIPEEVLFPNSDNEASTWWSSGGRELYRRELAELRAALPCPVSRPRLFEVSANVGRLPTPPHLKTGLRGGSVVQCEERRQKCASAPPPAADNPNPSKRGVAPEPL